jgi:hypothetical protein
MITTGPLVTRRTSARPASRSGQWWIVKTARAASKVSSSKGRASAVASIAGGRAGSRRARISVDGSTATTLRSVGS